MAYVISCINEKGGVGKTSLCFHTAWHLSTKRKVLLIDLDGQRANLSFFCGVNKTPGMKTMFHVLTAMESIKDCTVSLKKNLDIVPADNLLSDLSSTIKIKRMKEAIAEVKDEYDYIFIDVNPTPNWSHALTLSVTDYVVIPMLSKITSLEADSGIAESIEDILENTNPNLKIAGIVINMKDTRSNISKDIVRAAGIFAERMNTIVFNTKIRGGAVAENAIANHVGVMEYAKWSNVAKDFVAFTNELEKRIKKLEKENE